MSGLKITRELHAQVRETLKTKGIMSTAKKYGLSPQTVSRIKRGGRSYVGYKRELTADHVSLSSVFDSKPDFEAQADPPAPRVSRWQPNLFDRLVDWLKGLRG